MKFCNGNDEWIKTQGEISVEKCTLWRERFISFLSFLTEELNKLPATTSSDDTDNDIVKPIAVVTQDKDPVKSLDTITPIATKNTDLKSILPTKESTMTNPSPKKLDKLFNNYLSAIHPKKK